ncbi:peptidoglycan-binding protein [Brachybacterium paraconglomeratum]|uniref:peptidoglycan-binding protein n=1 Tax=Brachybacterium paraconglomeratum TaxID=173362 RepID=UPI0022E8CCF1|nr:peptidoglycan-binding protein [Brachybacterium paraconglomeratum]
MSPTLKPLPANWGSRNQVEKLTPATAASLSRVMMRAVAETGSVFNLNDGYRSYEEQVSLFKANYRNRGTKSKQHRDDRMFGGTAWRWLGGVKVASPDLYGTGTGAKHTKGEAIDVIPALIQGYLQREGLASGWSWDEGKRNGEPWHFTYHEALDQYRSEGWLDHAAVQRVVGAEVDGKIGPATAAKIRAWQKAHGLTADGKVGAKTKAAMGLAGKGDAAPAVPVTAGGGTSVPARAPAAQPEPTALAAAVGGIFPWADATTQFWDEKYPTQTYVGGEPIGLLHSTETSTWPGYGAGSSAPHLTVRFAPKARTIAARQHFSTTRPSRALVNKAGGVQTNNARVFQIELIGSCDLTFATKHGFLYLPDLLEEAWARDALAAVLAAVSESLGIPLTSSVVWANYPGSYGEKAAQRLTGAQWEAYSGWLGHQHAPENDHGDPGDIPIAEILASAGGDPTAVIAPSSGGGGSSSSKLPSGKDALMALIDAPDFPLLRTPGNLCYYGGDAKQTAVSGKMPNSLVPGEITGSGKTSGAEGLKAWQRRMNERGYSLTVDGRYGEATEKTAKNLQRLAGLAQDGAIGPDTWYAAWLLPVVS